MTKRDMLQATATEKSSNEENAELTNVLQYLAPWLEKTDGEEPIGSWETSLASKMMVKLLELWLTPESREKVEEILGYYHPLDRAAMETLNIKNITESEDERGNVYVRIELKLKPRNSDAH